MALLLVWAVSYLLFYCCDETTWPRETIKESICFGIQKPRGLELMTIRLKSTAAGTGHSMEHQLRAHVLRHSHQLE